jgi:hypothetical protein
MFGDTAGTILCGHVVCRSLAAKFPPKNSLFPGKISLLVCLGNLAKSPCGTAAFRDQSRRKGLKIAKIPCKIPCYIAGNLRGDRCDQHCVASQPVRRLEILPSAMAEMPANGGLLRFRNRSPGSQFGHFGSEIADSLRRTFEIFPFF